MKKAIVLLFLLLQYNGVSAQKTIIIDSLIGYTLDQSNIPIIQPIPKKGDEFLVDPHFNANITISKNHPNIIISGLAVNEVAILLDDKGGVLKLLSLNNLVSDTITIDKWTVYKNGLADTVLTSKAFFRMSNDSMAKEPYKIIRRKCASKNSGKKYVECLYVCINNIRYKIPVKTTSVYPHIPTSFHGYKTRKKYKDFIQKTKDDTTVYLYQKFMGEQVTIVRLFDATLKL